MFHFINIWLTWNVYFQQLWQEIITYFPRVWRRVCHRVWRRVCLRNNWVKILCSLTLPGLPFPVYFILLLYSSFVFLRQFPGPGAHSASLCCPHGLPLPLTPEYKEKGMSIELRSLISVGHLLIASVLVTVQDLLYIVVTLRPEAAVLSNGIITKACSLLYKSTLPPQSISPQNLKQFTVHKGRNAYGLKACNRT